MFIKIFPVGSIKGRRSAHEVPRGTPEQV